MALEAVVAAGGDVIIPVDAIKLTGALGGGEAGIYSFYYTGGSGGYNTVTRARVGSTSQYTLTIPVVQAQTGVVVFGDSSTLAVQQFQIFPDGPIKNTALRVWFVAPLTNGSVLTTAPTVVWSLAGSADTTLTPVAGTNAGFWYVDLSSAQTNADAGRLLVTGASVVPTSIAIFFTTTAASGGGGGGGTEENGMTINSTIDFSVTTGWTEVTSATGKTFRFGFSASDEQLFWKVASAQPLPSDRGEKASLSNNKEQTLAAGKSLWVRGTTAFTVSVHISA